MSGFTAPIQEWPRTRAADRTTPFVSAQEAWFWTMEALAARRDGRRGGIGLARRPCDPDDVIKVLDRLYRKHRIDLPHARVLRVYGERGVAPDTSHPSERADALLWLEAMRRMEWPLRVKGIVA